MPRGRRLLIVALLVAVSFPAAAARADSPNGSDAAREGGICELLDVVLPLDCHPAEPTTGGSVAAAAPTREASSFEQVRHTGTDVRYDPKRLTVTAERGASRTAIGAAFARAQVTLDQAVPAIRAYMVGVDPDRRASALASLRSSPAIAEAGREVLSSALAVDPNDAGWPQQWGLRIAGFPQAWDLVPSPQRVVVVAVVDTGVDPAQADLQGVLVPGYDFLNQSATPSDDEGHGTSVAGIIAARTGNRVGIAGVCGTCQIMPVKVLDAHGVGDDSVIAAGIVWAADHGAGVINLSLGGPGSTPALSDAIAYAVAKGALVIAAAGNEATTIPFYPAADPNAVSVAGTTAADRPYPWSDFGTWVKLAAPGCNIAPTVGGGYATFCGTSAATPVVSGLAAMARSASPAAGPQEIERALESSATPIAGFVQYGRINAAGTLSVLTPARTAAPTRVTFRGVLSARAPTRSYTRVVDAGTLTATLAFKGAPSVSLALVQDSPSGPGAVATGASPLRLVRLVQAGTVRIVVRAVRPRRARFVLTLHQSNGGP